MPDGTMIDRPIFIVGPGRSGTTLLRSLLSAHSRIAVTPETKFMARAEKWGLKSGAPLDFESFWEDYTSWLRFKDLGIEADRCRELIGLQNDYSFKSIFQAVLRGYGEKTGKTRIGEKTPTHVRYLPYLLDWFPDARVLVAQRDPRAVVASQMKTYWVGKKITPRSLQGGFLKDKREQEIIFWTKEWVSDSRTVLDQWEGDPRFYTVVYENLVSNVEEEVRAIFRFLGESFESSVLTERNERTVPLPVTKGIDPNMAKWRQEHHARSMGDISSDSLARWKKELSRFEIALIEGCSAWTMSALGYQPSLSKRYQRIGRISALLISTGGSTENKIRDLYAGGRRHLRLARQRLNKAGESMVETGLIQGIPPAWLGYRRVIRETVQDYFTRHEAGGWAGSYETVHPEAVAVNPLPRNFTSRDDLPAHRGWWGYSFRDVPERISGETFLATIPYCLITWYRDPAKSDDFYPAILTDDRRALDMREIRFRPMHGETLRSSGPPVRLKKATWIIERVYHNHSHWLTAHLPKLLLLREKNMLGNVLLPQERTAGMDGSLELLGLEPDNFQTFDSSSPLEVEKLTILGTDRFRPELLRLVPEAYGVLNCAPPTRKIYISRAKAARRRLLNEDEIWSILEPAGFESVLMEELSFKAQVALMKETAVLVAPHGAGLTNMMFCRPGCHIVEIADLGFPNPNFYALASALGHNYWLLSADSIGDLHPLEKDMRINPELIRGMLDVLQE